MSDGAADFIGRGILFPLRVDQSGGAHDVSYDAWNYLTTGYPATAKPSAGGAVAMETEDVDPSKCASLIHTGDGRLPLSAANSMNFLSSCLAQADSWVAKHYALYNILDPICSWGYDEKCTLDNWPAQNQATCTHPLGSPVALTSDPVYNVEYPSGKTVLASTGQVVAAGSASNAASNSFGWRLDSAQGRTMMLVAAGLSMLVHSLLGRLL